jgi:MYXO-CTERM domain-containing protein
LRAAASGQPPRRSFGCFTLVGIVVVAQIALVVLYRLGRATGWPVPVGLVAVAGLWVLRRRQRQRMREGR